VSSFSLSRRLLAIVFGTTVDLVEILGVVMLGVFRVAGASLSV